MFRTSRSSWLLLLTPITLFAAGANVYVRHDLVSDIPGAADVTDPHLVNPWGLAISATSPFWVSNTGDGTATIYNGSGVISPTVVTVPAAASGQKGTPTGQVSNTFTGVFLQPNGNRASFIFSTEDGTLSAWNGGTAAVIMVNNSAQKAVYYGLALGADAAGAPLLYAPNFTSGQMEVYDANWARTAVAGGFADPNVPAGYAPFNVWPLGGKLYVAYAKQGDLSRVGGAGTGEVAVFDFDGNLIKHLVSGGPLNAPWGMAVAPSTFGAFGGALLVGNFGDGKINAFDVNTGAALGTLQDTDGNALAFPGLWALIFGNGASGGDRNTLYVTAGIANLTHGLLSSVAPPAAILSVANAASSVRVARADGSPATIVAPGEVVVLSGITLGPSPTVNNPIPASGTVAGSPAGASVTFNGWDAPILSTSASATTVVVPYELGGFSSAHVVVTFKGQTAALDVPVALSAPGVYTADGSGAGQALALNADGTTNSSKAPAGAGSVITIFATGDGPQNPPGEDGVVNDRIFRTPQLPVSLTIGGKTARILYAGSSFGNVQGILQVEAIIPAGVTGAAPVVLTVGSAGSQPNVTVSVQ